MFGGGFRRCVWTVRFKRRILGEERGLVFRQAAHYFVGRHLDEPADPAFTSGVEQNLSSQNVCSYELVRRLNAAIHVRFGREVNHRIGLILERPQDRIPIADVTVRKTMTRCIQSVEVLRITRVRKRVKIDDFGSRLFFEDKTDERRTNKPGAARNK